MTKDKKYFISGSADYSIKVFDFETKEEVHHFKKVFHSKYIASILILIL